MKYNSYVIKTGFGYYGPSDNVERGGRLILLNETLGENSTISAKLTH